MRVPPRIPQSARPWGARHCPRARSGARLSDRPVPRDRRWLPGAALRVARSGTEAAFGPGAGNTSCPSSSLLLETSLSSSLRPLADPRATISTSSSGCLCSKHRTVEHILRERGA